MVQISRERNREAVGENEGGGVALSSFQKKLKSLERNRETTSENEGNSVVLLPFQGHVASRKICPTRSSIRAPIIRSMTSISSSFCWHLLVCALVLGKTVDEAQTLK